MNQKSSKFDQFTWFLNRVNTKNIKFGFFIKIFVGIHDKCVSVTVIFRSYENSRCILIPITGFVFPLPCRHVCKKESHNSTQHIRIDKSVEPIFDFPHGPRENPWFSCQIPNYEVEKIVYSIMVTHKRLKKLFFKKKSPPPRVVACRLRHVTTRGGGDFFF